jgi:site-specific recombinase XerD
LIHGDETVLPFPHPGDLRIAFGTELAEGGFDMDLVYKVLGNSRAIAEKYYTKVSPESAPRQALRVLNGGRKK